MVFNNNLLLGAAGQSTGQAPFDPTLIGNSIWLDGSGTSGDAATATWGTESNQDRWIWATWYSPSREIDSTGDRNTIFSSGGASNGFYLRHNSTASTFNIFCRDNAGNEGAINTSESYRDLTAWYFILVDFDSANAVATDRISLYVNGVRVGTYSGTSIGQNNHLNTNVSGQTARIGQDFSSTPDYHMQGYLAQTVFLDNKSIANGDLAITDFLDTFTFGTNGSQIVPKSNTDIIALANAAGNNSFCLDYSDGSNIVNDASSKGNNFTPTGGGSPTITSTNQSINTPSKYYPKVSNMGIPSGDTAANYTMDRGSNRMVYSGANQGYKGLISTQLIQPDDSPIYWEYYLESGSVGGASGGRVSVGLCVPNFNVGIGAFSGAGGNNPSNLRGEIYDNGPQGATTGSTLIGVGDIQNLAYEPSTGKIWFGVNGTWNNGSEAASTTLNPSGHDYQATAQDYVFFISASRSTDIGVLNFGDNPSMSGNITAGTETDANGYGLFKYAVPSGFFAPVSANLTAPDYQGIDYFNATLYTGNGTAIGSGGKAVTGVGFQSDFTWIKNRDAADSHILTDVVRGVTKYMSSDSTAAEVTNTESLSTFDTDGFTVGNLDAVNTNTEDYVSWNWLAGGTGSSNTDGSITSTVTVAGAGHFSIGTYTGTGANATVGHGLNGAPELVIVKNTNDNRAWRVLETIVNGGTHYLTLNTTAASTAGSTFWNDSNPTASVINLGSDTDTNDSGDTMLAISFRSVPGVCKVGSYVGNLNSDGPYIDLGFTPRFFLVKVTDGVNNWGIFDTARNTFNASNRTLNANDATVEDTSYPLDILSSGIKIRGAFQFFNDTGKTYLYLAMADIGGNGTLPPVYGR
jgi:hypothetical protein